MKIIYPDNITAVVGSTENASFPDDNVLDDYPKKVWKATNTTATLTLSVSSGASACAVFNTNASSISWQVKIGEVVQESGNVTPYRNNAWIDYTQIDEAHTIVLSFTASANVEAGVVRAGACNDLPAPDYGVQESFKDLSISKEMNNGARYYLKRDLLRTLSFQALVTRTSELYTLLDTIFYENGNEPLAWQIDSGLTEDWVIFGTLDNVPVASHDFYTHATIRVGIQEAI